MNGHEFTTELEREAVFPEVWEFPVGDDLVLARPGVPGLFCLNHTAGALWAFLRSRPNPAEAAEALAAAAGISREQADRDVAALLQQWSASQLTGPLPLPEISPGLSHRPFAQPSLAQPGIVEFYALNGRTFQISANNSDEFRMEIAPRLAHLLTAPCAPEFIFQLLTQNENTAIILDGAVLSVEDSYPRARTILLQELARLSEPDREWLALLHAGACGLGSRCVVFPGASHSGKTTLAATLAHSGFQLYSDDFAGLEKGRLAVPTMPFALALREGSWPLLRNRLSRLDDFPVYTRYGEKLRYVPIPDQSGHRTADPIAMVFTRWVPNSTRTLSSLSTLEALLQLKDAGLWVCPDRESIGTFLTWLEALPKYALAYSDLDDAVDFFKELFRETKSC